MLIPIPNIFLSLMAPAFQPVRAQAKARGYQILGRCCYFNPSLDILAENFPFGSPLFVKASANIPPGSGNPCTGPLE
jgi:hypothetical protein